MRALCVAMLCCAAVLAADDTTKKDLAALEGEWTMVSGTSNGKELPADLVKTGKRTFKDGVGTVEIDGNVIMKAKITLGVKDKIKTVDYEVTEGAAEGKKVLGIYEITGDEIKFCIAAPDAERPTKFESKEDSKVTLSVWKKVKAEKK